MIAQVVQLKILKVGAGGWSSIEPYTAKVTHKGKKIHMSAIMKKRGLNCGSKT